MSITAGTRDSAPAALRFADLPDRPRRLQGAFLTPTSGGAAGQRLMITGVLDGLVMLGFGGMSIPVLETIRVGDTVEIDNSDYLAAQTYHRHQDPGPEYPVWDQFKAPDGSHLYPVRPLLKGYDQVGEGNSWQSGNFDCKVISVNCLLDEAAFPWQADWYRQRVMANYGPEFLDRYRLWFVDRAMHVNPSRYLSPNEGFEPRHGHGPTDTQIVSYQGVLHQALRDVAAWAERGVEPPGETTYQRRRRADRGASDRRGARWRAAGRDADGQRCRACRRDRWRARRTGGRRRGAAGRWGGRVRRMGLRRLRRPTPTSRTSPRRGRRNG